MCNTMCITIQILVVNWLSYLAYFSQLILALAKLDDQIKAHQQPIKQQCYDVHESHHINRWFSDKLLVCIQNKELLSHTISL